MDNRLTQLTEFLELTTAILEQAQTIHSDMEKNEPEQLEALQELFDDRQQTIEALSVLSTGDWTEPEQRIITRIQQTEIQLQPLMTNLYEQFAQQLNRINQTKQASGKYAGAYRQTASGGSFIDQRK